MQLVTDGDPCRFAQIWPSAATGDWVVREGTLGRAGSVRETGMNPESTPIDQLAAPYLDKGFIEVDDDGRDVVVIQFPMRNSAYDCRLIERATEWLDVFLDERGLGFVDGHDRGARAGDGKIVINIFARVVDGELGATAGMAASRKGAADAAHATIAHHAADADDWTLRYERTSGKLPGAFRV